MSAAYVSDGPIAVARGDMLWLEFKSGGERISLALTRNAAVHLFRDLTSEVRGPLFATLEGEIVAFKKARKPRGKAVWS